jgi:heme-degrading monooxygenase HmoA
MFVRLLQVHVKSDSVTDLPSFFNSFMLPVVRNAPGCLYAGFIQSDRDSEESIAVTLWDTQEHADSYAQSGVFQKLMNRAESIFSDVLEWKVQLSQDVNISATSFKDEPVVKPNVATKLDPQHRSPLLNGNALYVRILSVRLLPGRAEEFAKLYNELIIPTLRLIRGCRYAFLTEGMEERSEVISVTIWDRKEDAELYESMGVFDSLKNRVRHTFTDVFEWKLTADKSSQQVQLTDDMMAHIDYRVIGGRSFL